ncbi:LppA family lipoprotein [Saccharopolyspora sp. TS4A08]|uniref:LppA family lipoprotein n=1 Tax=Saccharopolyspora ipomoeae TaxID=3042027 RepID=A0ABT6PHH1_9PSEU|nr:LppA family lipoprotein [Saccharopolyspora sp. TS4A08]MDI2027399.1 LppA family lipoprotein [Saccharopolyspora sp. TS4A08]
MISKHGGSIEEQQAELMRRPSMEEASARYQEMLARMRDALTARFPWMQWQTSEDVLRSGCAEFDAYKDDLETQELGIWVAFGTLPEEEWPEAQRIATDIGASYGFAPPRVFSTKPGDHHITALDGFRATWGLSGGNNISLSGNTGCHLPQAAKDRIAATGQ